MKKATSIFFCLFIGIQSFSQTKAEKAHLKYISDFYEELKDKKMNTSGDLFWKYTYRDTSLAVLTKLSKVLEKESLKTMTLGKSKAVKDMYDLTVYEKKTYKNAKLLNERVLYINSVAKIFNLAYDEATVGASRPDKTSYIGEYDPVGKDKKKMED